MQSKKRGEVKKFALLAKRPKQFASRLQEGDYSTDFGEARGRVPPKMSGQGKLTTAKHPVNHFAKGGESGERHGHAALKSTGGKHGGGGKKLCERGEGGQCQGIIPKKVAGKQRNRRRQRKKYKKYANKKQKRVQVQKEKEVLRMEDMMDIRELQDQHHREEQGREMQDYPSSLKASSSSSSSLGSPASLSGNQPELPFLSSYPRAATIEQLIGDPLEDWNIHMPNSEFFNDNK